MVRVTNLHCTAPGHGNVAVGLVLCEGHQVVGLEVEQLEEAAGHDEPALVGSEGVEGDGVASIRRKNMAAG